MPFDLSTAKPVGEGGFDLSTAQPVEDDAPPATTLERAGAVAGGVNEGVMRTIMQMGPDAIANVLNLAKVIGGMGVAGAQTVAGKPVDIPEFLQVQDEDRAPFGDALVNAANKLPGRPASNPRPDDQVSRYLNVAGQGIGGALVSPATGAKFLPSAVAGITGSTAGQFAAEQGASNEVQVLAGLAGGVAPSVARIGIAEGARRLARGGEEGRQRVAQNIQTFEDAGTKPSIGQATESRVARATESLLTRAPGGAGRMADRAEAQGQEIGANIETLATKLSPKASGEQAGRAIQRGITGDDGFVAAFKKKQETLYDELDTHIAKDMPVKVGKTSAALQDLNQDIKGAPAISEFFKNAKIKGIEGALKADTKNGATLPYEAIKKLRTLVGREMADSSIMSDVPRSKWKALYAALSGDLESAATGAGPKATAAFNRANNFTRAGMKRLEVLDSVVDKAGGPEAVFRAATSGAKEGATTLRAVMQSLPDKAKKTLSAGVLRRMGRATSGRQDDLGEKFSTETFLTNWNAMSPQAKAVLFDRYGKGFRQDMDSVAKVASNLREGSAVFRNPSGTSQAAAQTGAVVAFVTALATGSPGTAAVVAGGIGGANLSARIMTNPAAVAWLAKTTKAPRSALPALINQAAQSNDPDLRELAALMKKRRDGERNN